MRISTGKKKGPRKILLYGQHGVGKSTFAAGAPRAIFLPIEDGLKDIDCASFDHEDLKSFPQVIAALHHLLASQHNFGTVVVDTVDWLEQIIFREIAEAAHKPSVMDIDFGKGPPRAVPKWQEFMSCLDSLYKHRGMTIILLAHARIEKFSNPDGATYDRYAPDLWTNSRGEGVGNILQEWADEVLFAHFKVFVRTDGKGLAEKAVAVGGKDRVIKTCENASALAKNRIGLPEEIPMDWATYASFVKAAYEGRGVPKAINEQPIEAVKPDEPAGNIAGIVNDGSSKKPAPVSEEGQLALAEIGERF